MKYIEFKNYFSSQSLYTLIIGLNPSKGARSPILWNSVFNEKSLKVKMLPLDVDENNLDELLNYLSKDINFKGGAIAVPFKENVAIWLGANNLTNEAQKIGAVNCLFRSDDGVLMGTNTDGEASINCFMQKFGSIKNKNVLQFGCGGAGKAVSTYFSTNGAKITLVVRNINSKLVKFANSISANIINWNDLKNPNLLNTDIIINTTDIGFSGSFKQNEKLLSEDQIDGISHNCIVYDIIYDPTSTNFLKSCETKGLRIYNGTDMNLEQAVIGFSKCFPEISILEVREIMLIEKNNNNW